jgi:hypothetical protein
MKVFRRGGTVDVIGCGVGSAAAERRLNGAGEAERAGAADRAGDAWVLGLGKPPASLALLMGGIKKVIRD